MEIQHVGHDQPLIFCEEGNARSKALHCAGCGLLLSGATYRCKEECIFILHKSCAELPNTIIHFLHPKHPLTFCHVSPYERPPVCDYCDERIWGFIYHCSICNYDLDIKCVNLREIVENEGHQHSFMLLRPSHFCCDACGETARDISYICTTCQLWLHKNCVSLPPPVDSTRSNNLSLAFVDHDLPAPISLHDEATTDFVTNEVSENNLEKENELEIQHFSHQTTMTLSDNEKKVNEICDACIRPLSSVPFYQCEKCNYFLHTSCARLPKIIQHLLHPHPLHLVINTKWKFFLFLCRACWQWSNGFAYHCSICYYTIDVRCASFLKPTLKHQAHEHTLTLVNKESQSKCIACGSNCTTKFRCEKCDFNLDLRCAALPLTARNEWDEHNPIKLTFSTTQDKSETYYCDICEEKRDPDHWFYQFEDPDLFSAHPFCVFGKHAIKFQTRFKHDDYSGHTLTFVPNSGLYPQCESSSNSTKPDFVLRCIGCTFYKHMTL